MFAVLQLEHGLFAAFSRWLIRRGKPLTNWILPCWKLTSGVAGNGRIYVCRRESIAGYNALYRHPELQVLRDETQEDHAKARQRSLILIMSRWTEISLHGQWCRAGYGNHGHHQAIREQPANFLDVGGGATQERVSKPFG